MLEVERHREGSGKTTTSRPDDSNVRACDRHLWMGKVWPKVLENNKGYTVMIRKFYVGAALAVLPLMFAQNVMAQAPRNVCTPFNQGFTLYFEHNSAAVTDMAEQVVEQAVSNAAQNPTCVISHVTIEGHTDTSGTTEKNMFLSHAIALNVKDALVEQGVDKRVISTAGKGETALEKATRDDVREPLNRRAEIKIFLAPK